MCNKKAQSTQLCRFGAEILICAPRTRENRRPLDGKLDEVLYVRVPADLTVAFSEAAQRELLPVATWARRVLAREVRYIPEPSQRTRASAVRAA
jgi:hypothetical protein